MKQETNNEMDLLLRQLARRQDVLAPDAEDHLDADELSAYAENVLPAKARARYTEHLAECSRCRELVVQLSPSAGVVVAHQADKVSGPVGMEKVSGGSLLANGFEVRRAGARIDRCGGDRPGGAASTMGRMSTFRKCKMSRLDQQMFRSRSSLISSHKQALSTAGPSRQIPPLTKKPKQKTRRRRQLLRFPKDRLRSWNRTRR